MIGEDSFSESIAKMPHERSKRKLSIRRELTQSPKCELNVKILTYILRKNKWPHL